MARFRFLKDFVDIKAGAEYDSEREVKKFIFIKHGGKQIAVPRLFVEEIGASKSSGPDVAERVTGMTEEEAAELARALGVGGVAAPEKKAEPEPPKEKAPLDEKKGEFYLSSITGGKLPSSGIDHVMRPVAKGTFTKDQLLDVPAKDATYVWNPDLLEAMWLAYILNKKMLISGYPGTGKTTAVAQFCAIIGHPMMRFNGKDGIEASSFLGYPWGAKGGMEWKDGMLPQGVRSGYIVTIDEVFKIPAGIQMAMQNLYEENGYLTLDDKPGTVEEKTVKAHPMFRMFLTDNVKGTGDSFDKYAATQVQDSSTLDRFGITATLNYMAKNDEVKMLQGKYPDIDKSTIVSLVTFANLVRNGYAKSEISLTLSPRGLQTICEILGHMDNIQRAIQLVFMDKLGEDDEIDAVKEMIRTVYR